MTLDEALKLQKGDTIRLSDLYVCDDGVKIPAKTPGVIVDWHISGYHYVVRMPLLDGWTLIKVRPEQMERIP